MIPHQSPYAEEDEDLPFTPPTYPPPFLTDAQILSLAHQGHLSLPLSPHLSSLYTSLSQSSSLFFSSPAATKVSLYPSSEGTECGYTHLPDEKEYLTLRCTSQSSSDLEVLATRVWRDSAALLHRILVDFARALNLPVPYQTWDALLDGCLDMPTNMLAATPSLLRLFRYFPKSGAAESHTDLGLLTLCFDDGRRGLQVLAQPQGNGQGNGPGEEKRQQGWVDVDGPTILIGQTLRFLAGNRVRAGVHRVVENPEGRSSVVFTLRASLRHPVDLGLFGGEGTMDPKVLWGDIKGSKVNINAMKDVRERQRENMKAKRETILRG